MSEKISLDSSEDQYLYMRIIIYTRVWVCSPPQVLQVCKFLYFPLLEKYIFSIG